MRRQWKIKGSIYVLGLLGLSEVKPPLKRNTVTPIRTFRLVTDVQVGARKRGDEGWDPNNFLAGWSAEI